MVTMYSNDDVSTLLDLEACVDVLERAYEAVGREVSNPRTDVQFMVPSEPLADVHAIKTMSGGLSNLGIQAVRVDSDLIRWRTVDGRTRREKVTSAQDDRIRVGKENGIVLLYSTETAELLAIVPDGELQRRRVAATNALAASIVGPEDVEVVGMLGTGWQATTSALALDAVLEPAEIRVHSPTPTHREAFEADVSDRVDATLVVHDAPRQVCEGAAVVQCATNATEPVVEDAWIDPGAHVNCVRSLEIDPRTLDRADEVVYNSVELSESNVVVQGGDVPASITRDYSAPPETAVDLASVVRHGRRPERGPIERTCFVNNIGLGIQFAATGRLLLDASEGGAYGSELPDELFLQDVPQR